MPQLKCIVVTPEQTLCDRPADFVVATLFDGEIGIGAGHTPLIGRLGYGELRIRQGDATDRYYVEGGFVEVVNNVISLLTHRAIAAEKIDKEAATRQLEEAEGKDAGTPELRAARSTEIAQARAQLRVASRS